ncbi:phospholipid carrier-dependent glycosyltransferase [Candidatus Daviesbacteria bacterium]|nr:phospholipid carrier-dependent glycosyltransferase [Candidatus Daviesbacteria bacterium]
MILILFSAFLRFFRLDYPNSFVFDEVYHAFTAKEYLKGSKEAWEWWTKPPEDVAFEWTHPPLAKEIMTASMFVLQSTDAWAWRIPGVILGLISILLIYQIASFLFKNTTLALFSAFVFSFDGLNFVQSRIGMNDIYFITFALFCLLFFFKKKYFLSSVFLGLSLSSKWSALYLYLFLFLIFTFQNHSKKINLNFLKKLIYFLSIPPAIYLITYIPFFTLGHNFSQFIELQKQMFWYHTGLKASHDYSSPWWSWPFNLYPVWYFVDYHKNSISNIFASGNIVVFYSGVVAIILSFIEFLRRRSFALFIILAGYFVFLLPWAFSPRIMFLYHYSPSIPFLSLALGYQLNHLYENNSYKKYATLLLFLILFGFLLTFPILVGIPLPKNLLEYFFLTNLTKNPF